MVERLLVGITNFGKHVNCNTLLSVSEITPYFNTVALKNNIMEQKK